MKKFVTWITLRDGTRIYARDYGKRAFCIEVGENDQKKEPAVHPADPT